MGTRARIVRWISLVILATSSGFAGGPGFVWGDVKLPAVFTSNLVLQREKPVNIWGWASPGEDVLVTFGNSTAKAKADLQGKWKTQLPPQKTSSTPSELVIAGRNKITLSDVLVGEVWVGAGQSNMLWPIAESLNPKLEIAGANFPDIRLFHIPLVPAGTPSEDVNASWQKCSPETVATFSGVLFSFGRHLHVQLGRIPVGLILSAWGGTKIEAWIPPAGFDLVPSLAQDREALQSLVEGTQARNDAYLRHVKDWIPQAEKALADSKELPLLETSPKHLANSHEQHTGLYNGMIHAVVPYSIRGVTWYQGEANRLDGARYHELMKGLILGWRKIWDQGDIPFYYVQLTSLMYQRPAYALAEVREAQLKSLSILNTGMVVTTDIGELNNIHPPNKREVGRRLALWALAKNYEKSNLEYSGPLYKGMVIEGEKIRIKFDHAKGMYSRGGGALTWFQIAGKDKIFANAVARIDGEDVLVWAGPVHKPVAVRFGWHQIAEPNLMNGANLPASPFRTDDWETATNYR